MAELPPKEFKALRRAIQSVYTSHARLQLFVDENIERGLALWGPEDELDVAVSKLIRWAEGHGRLPDLLNGLKEDVPGRDDILVLCDEILARIDPSPLVSESGSYPTLDLDNLFQHFEAADLKYVLYAFQAAFQVVYKRTFYQMRPAYSETDSLKGIQYLLERYSADAGSGPELAVRFVEFAITELQRSAERARRADARNFFRGLENWRRRTAQDFNITSSSQQATSLRRRRGYLLVAFQVSNDDIVDINVSAELYLGETFFCGRPDEPNNRCTLDTVSQDLSKWILSAKRKLAKLGCGQICIELLLPHKLIEVGIDRADSWQVQGLQPPVLMNFQSENYVIRPLDRVIGPDPDLVQFVQNRLADNWEELENCKNQPACEHFYIPDDCPTVSDVNNLEATGLGLTAHLPKKLDERHSLLAAIINSGVPIAFWYGPKNKQSPAERLQTLSSALAEQNVTDFLQLAQVWRNLRSQDNVRLLVDCPYRLHGLSDAENVPMVAETLNL
jgi:hypothetical protein